MKCNNYNDIKKACAEGWLVENHTATERGYVSRRVTEEEYEVVPYRGRYGKGYKVYKPNYNSTSYCYVTYYIEKEGAK